MLIACSNPDTLVLTTIPASPTAPSAAAPANTPTPTPEEVSTLTESPDEEKVLTILYWQAPTLPGPYLSPGNKDEDAGAITLEPLAKHDPDGNPVPSLAAEIPTIENGGVDENLTSITWKLNEDLKWSDGSDMTAHGVASPSAPAQMKLPDARPARRSPEYPW
jgi:peptide/nickel transport system substrate-binding protein